MKRTTLLCFSSLLLLTNFGWSQEKTAGPVIKNHGKVWEIENPTYETKLEKEFKVVFDIMTSPDSHKTVNPSIETAARFLNMHAQHGVATENLKAVLVVHNKASKDIMSDEAYRKRYQLDNPNTSLVKELLQAGVEIVFCGQSSASRNIPIADTQQGVKLSLSAMTALIQLQDEGYRLIKF